MRHRKPLQSVDSNGCQLRLTDEQTDGAPLYTAASVGGLRNVSTGQYVPKGRKRRVIEYKGCPATTPIATCSFGERRFTLWSVATSTPSTVPKRLTDAIGHLSYCDGQFTASAGPRCAERSRALLHDGGDSACLKRAHSLAINGHRLVY